MKRGLKQRYAQTKRAQAGARRSRAVTETFARAVKLASVADKLDKAGHHKEAKRVGAKAQRLYAGAARSGKLAGPVGVLPNPCKRETIAEGQAKIGERLLRARIHALHVLHPSWTWNDIAEEIALRFPRLGHEAALEYVYEELSTSAKRNPGMPPFDESDLEAAFALGLRQEREDIRAGRSHRLGLKTYKGGYFSKLRGKTVEFIQPLHAHSVAEAKAQVKAMVTNEKPVNVTAREVKINPRGGRKGYANAYSVAAAKGYPYIRGEGEVDANGYTWLSRFTKNSEGTGPALFVGWDEKQKRWIVREGNPTVYGTSYFVSRAAAIRYYAEYEPGESKAAIAAWVDGKIKQGEIHIGKPPYDPTKGERLITLDGGKRYGVSKPNPEYRSKASRPVVTIEGVKYEVLVRHTPAEHEAEGRANLARELRKHKIVADLWLKKPRGNAVYIANEYASGYSRPRIIPGNVGFTADNPGIVDLASTLQAADYLGGKLGGKRKRNASEAQLTAQHAQTAVVAAAQKYGYDSPEAEAAREAWRKASSRYQRSKRKRANPSLQELSETFQGKITGTAKSYYASNAAPANLARVGKLVFITLGHGNVRVPGAVVAMDTKERLWLVGAHVPMFHSKANKGERLNYGPVTRICYETVKAHIEPGRKIEYDHKFEKPYPHLHVDDEGMPIIVGGGYKIKAEGITG